MDKAAVAIDLTAPERRELASLARTHRTGQAMARRARIVLAAAAGRENKAICVEVGADANTVSKWRRRFATRRLDGLLDEPRAGAPRRIGDDEIAETIRLALEGDCQECRVDRDDQVVVTRSSKRMANCAFARPSGLPASR